MTLKIFSFFSGAGLLDLGFEQAGFEILRVNEFHAPFLSGYKYAREKFGTPPPRFGFDSESIDTYLNYGHKLDELKEQVKIARQDGSLVGFIGGPPCPDFSVGGKNRGQDGENGRLSASYVQLIKECIPDFFLFENVKGLWRTKRHRFFYEQLKSELRNSGFQLADQLINSIAYGVPQDRERVILLGFSTSALESIGGISNQESLDFPWKTYQKWNADEVFILNWPQQEPFSPQILRPRPSGIVEELTVQYWFEKNQVHRHPNSMHCFKPRQGLKRFLTVDEGDDLKKSYKRLHRWRFSPTACYGNNEVHLHPFAARRITVAEAMAIQSLPKEFELPTCMSLSNMFKTIGNGVPFLAAKSLASSISLFLKEGNNAPYSRRPCIGDLKAAETTI